MIGRLARGLFLVSLLVSCRAESPAKPSTTRPNVLILMVDALRADRLGVNGHSFPTTPNIDELAGEGISFTRAFAHSTWTKPSIATLFTSRYASQHGLDQVAIDREGSMQTEVLGADHATLAESFRSAGYLTAAVVNQVHITKRFGFDQGFEFFDEWRGMGAPRLNRKFLRWLAAQETDERPYFAYIHYLDVHWPYTKRDWRRAGSLGSVVLSREPPDAGRQSVSDWAAELDLPGDLEALQARYDHEVAYTDRAVGELVAGLRQLGLLDNTVVVVTADHGEAFLEHGELLHGTAPYEELIRVPLVLRLPTAMRRWVGRSEVPVGLIDVAPTLLDLVGLEPLPEAQGRSFLSVIRGEELRPRLVFAETEDAVAARGDRYKLFRFSDGSEQLFDLTADPGEHRPLDLDCGAPCDHLDQRMEDFSLAMAAAREGLQTALAPLDEKDLQEMRALGYLD